MWTKILAVAALASVMACTGGNKGGLETPQKVLSEYVSRSFAVKAPVEKSKLLELTTGEVKNAIERLDEAAFRSYFIDSKREFLGLKVKDERNVGADQYSITYELSYMSRSSLVAPGSEPSVDRVTNKKHALFVNQNGKWLISEVKSLKTLIEHQNEMSF